MLLSCSDKVSNITISPSSPKNCYKPISKIAPIYSAETVSSSRWQCKLLGWIMSVSFRGVYQRGSITHRPKSAIGRPGASPARLQAAGALPWNSLLLLLRTQDGAQSHHYMATLEAGQLERRQTQERSVRPTWRSAAATAPSINQSINRFDQSRWRVKNAPKRIIFKSVVLSVQQYKNYKS